MVWTVWLQSIERLMSQLRLAATGRAKPQLPLQASRH